MTGSSLTTSTATRRRRRRHYSESVDDPLLRVVDGGLAACILLLPLIMGGRQALGELVLLLLAAGVTLAWLLRELKSPQFTWQWSSLEGVFLAGAILLLLQFLPLPQPLLEWLAPRTAQILPLWSSQAGSTLTLGSWPCVSFAPSDTRAGLMTLIAYCLLFLITVQRIRRTSDVERLLRWCAFSAVLMASFGIVQFLTSNGKFFWFYQHPYSSTDDVAKGSFVNRNHFADFLALGIGPLMWWIQRALRHHQSDGKLEKSSGESSVRDLLPPAGIVALGIVVFACLLSLSRGGMMAMVVAAVVAGVVCYRAAALSFRFTASLGAVVLLVAICLAVFGYDRVGRRLSDLPSGSFEQIDHSGARTTIWTAVGRALPDFLTFGAGVGSLRDVYPRFLSKPTGPDYYTHAENGPLQIALETGVPGTVLLIVVIGLCVFWCLDGLRRVEDRHAMVCLGAVSAALAASLAHSMVDFNWYCPGCMAVVTVLAACGCRLWQLVTEQGDASRRLVAVTRPCAVALTVVLLCVGGWMLYHRVGSVIAERHWYQVQLMDLTSDTQRHLIQEDRASAPDRPDPQPGLAQPTVAPSLQPSEEALLAAMDTRNLDELLQLIRWEPDHARAHLRLAGIYLRQFHRLQQQCPNVMPLGQIRETVFAARQSSQNSLTSRSALDAWMRRAFGDHCHNLDLALMHTHRALSLAPLIAEGYLYLGELCFLEGGGPQTKTAYVEQALKLQPFDPLVLFTAGTEAWLAGHFQQGLDYLRASFHAGDDRQAQIFDWLAGRAPPEGRQAEIQFLIEFFQPDYQALKVLDRRYSQIARPEELVNFHRWFAQAAEAEAAKPDDNQGRTAVIWLTANALYEKVGDFARASSCGQNALRLDPNKYLLRHQLGMFYLRMQQYDEAKRHFQWCLGRRPHDENVKSRLTEVEKLRLAQQTPGLLPLVAPGSAMASGPVMPQETALGPGSTTTQQPTVSLGYRLPPSPMLSPGVATPPASPQTVTPQGFPIPPPSDRSVGSSMPPGYVR